MFTMARINTGFYTGAEEPERKETVKWRMVVEDVLNDAQGGMFIPAWVASCLSQWMEASRGIEEAKAPSLSDFLIYAGAITNQQIATDATEETLTPETVISWFPSHEQEALSDFMADLRSKKEENKK